MKKIVLFDMDGTLTPARQSMNKDIADKLQELQESGFEIGIVTGSDMDYVEQQCSVLFDNSLISASKIHFLPCNGTKYILNGKTIYEQNMRSHLGSKLWKRLMSILIGYQNDFSMNHGHLAPMTGHFINYRGSMINWCPIGRNATLYDRKMWEEYNESDCVRKRYLEALREDVQDNINHLGDLTEDIEIEIKLGGDTSFDIFPKGWDKTYAFRNFEDYEKIFFVGDRCGFGGNDKEAYELAGDLGFETTCPKQTIDIIDKIITED
jgi:phosphomannomutase